jgi:hypothetical protein
MSLLNLQRQLRMLKDVSLTKFVREINQRPTKTNCWLYISNEQAENNSQPNIKKIKYLGIISTKGIPKAEKHY